MKYSIVLPCRDEEASVGVCIVKIRRAMRKLDESDYEIIVSDSSTDDSPRVARKLGATVIKHDKAGYGNAYLEGFKHVKGDKIIMGDADDSYDFSEIPDLLKHAKDYDLVLGRRAYLQKDAMPFLNRYIGNPLLSWTLRFLFGSGIRDAHTGFRIIKREKLENLELKTTGMEFASEMIIKAIENDLKIIEVPIHYHPRKGKTKMRRLPDGWRHLRFMLLYHPFKRRG